MVCGRGFDSRRLHQIPETKPAIVPVLLFTDSSKAGVEPAFFNAGPSGPQSFAFCKLQKRCCAGIGNIDGQ